MTHFEGTWARWERLVGERITVFDSDQETFTVPPRPCKHEMARWHHYVVSAQQEVLDMLFFTTIWLLL